MLEELNWIWIEKAFRKIPLPYPVASIIVGFAVFLIFGLFSTQSEFLKMDPYHLLEISITSLLIASQLAGIQYLLISMKKTFWGLGIPPEKDLCLRTLKDKFDNTLAYYSIVVLIIAIFFIIELREVLCVPVLCEKVSFLCPLKSALCVSNFDNNNIFLSWTCNNCLVGLIYDIFNYVITYFSYFLLSILIWMLFNLSLTIEELSSESYRGRIQINLFSIDNIGGLKPLRDLVLKAAIIYFTVITLTIISIISPFSVLTFESVFLFILLLIGIVSFVVGLMATKGILMGKIEYEIDKINEKYQELEKKRNDLLSKEKYSESDKDLDFLITSMENLSKEREQLMHINTRIVDLKAISSFVSVFFTSLLAFYHQAQGLGLAEIVKILRGLIKL